MNKPIHLKCDNPTVDKHFEGTEIIFRRFMKSEGDKEGEYFSSIPTLQFVKGVSANRQKYGSKAEDVLWSIIDGDNCLYLLKNGEVIYTTINDLNSDKNKTGIKIICEHTPFKCNCSHCDLKFDPDIANKSKLIQIEVRLFMSTIFLP